MTSQLTYVGGYGRIAQAVGQAGRLALSSFKPCVRRHGVPTNMTSICRQFSSLTVSNRPTKSPSLLQNSWKQCLLKQPSASKATRWTMKKHPKIKIIEWRTYKKTYYQFHTGKELCMTHVLDRFYRLHNGLWIKTVAGRNRRKWRKRPGRVWRARFHVGVTRSQAQRLDRMVTKKEKMPHYFPDDPYNPYHRMDMLRMYKYTKPKFLP